MERGGGGEGSGLFIDFRTTTLYTHRDVQIPHLTRGQASTAASDDSAVFLQQE